jgi:hypothetical protein
MSLRHAVVLAVLTAVLVLTALAPAALAGRKIGQPAPKAPAAELSYSLPAA